MCQNKKLPIKGEGPKEWNEQLDRELKWLYHEHNVPTGKLNSNNQELFVFTAKFNSIMAQDENQFTPKDVMTRLIRLRKSGNLGPLRKSSSS